MSKPSITNCPNTFFGKVHSFNCIFSSLSCFACVQIRHTPLSGGYCGEVPPLPIPNREVKLTCADGTAMQCGRVGSRLLLFILTSITSCNRGFLFIHLLFNIIKRLIFLVFLVNCMIAENMKNMSLKKTQQFCSLGISIFHFLLGINSP